MGVADISQQSVIVAKKIKQTAMPTRIKKALIVVLTISPGPGGK